MFQSVHQEKAGRLPSSREGLHGQEIRPPRLRIHLRQCVRIVGFQERLHVCTCPVQETAHDEVGSHDEQEDSQMNCPTEATCRHTGRRRRSRGPVGRVGCRFRILQCVQRGIRCNHSVWCQTFVCPHSNDSATASPTPSLP